MRKIICTTTINEPNEAIAAYDGMEDWHLIVVGDLNGPDEYKLKRGRFISWGEQLENYPALCDLVGPCSTTRGRMIAFIEAYKAGADIVATIDDDNFPYENWATEVFIGKAHRVQVYNGTFCFEPLGLYSSFGVRHRGFPLELQSVDYGVGNELRDITPKLQANLWHGDPDIDAVDRLVKKPIVPKNFPWLLSKCGEKFMPVNTQNTFIDGRYLRDFCPLPFVGRHEDIWAGYIFQQIHPHSTIYGPPTVEHKQNRSIASLLNDIENELFGMRHGMRFLEILSQFGPEEAIKQVCQPATFTAWELYRSYFE